ncbi:MAG: class I SAM-dependent methyltransferase [Gemmatimonadetes bacterium]|nr:class I SAM-dependent methyltransferase [Gemmatimonadota bacterium]
MRLYSEFAQWWPLLSPPSHYPEEAAHLLSLLPPPDGSRPTLLELGSGGGSLAHHLRSRYRLTLTDLSPEMSAVSRAVNPEVEHLAGDMRTLRLDRQFDVVLIHDAIGYMLDRGALDAAIGNAARHCRPGGTVVVLPDETKETFEPGTESGGEDVEDGRGLRYLEWCWDPDPSDTEYRVAYALVYREADGTVRHGFDLQRHGLFSKAEWDATFAANALAVRSVIDPWDRMVFVGTKP